VHKSKSPPELHCRLAVHTESRGRATKQQLRALAEKRGFNIDELFGRRGGKRDSSVAKYRNPRDSTQTWAGRGSTPNWLIDAL
jgi:DNA-binding protein H-NS